MTPENRAKTRFNKTLSQEKDPPTPKRHYWMPPPKNGLWGGGVRKIREIGKNVSQNARSGGGGKVDQEKGKKKRFFDKKKGQENEKI